MTRELRSLYCGCRFAAGDRVADGAWYGIPSREAEAQRLSTAWQWDIACDRALNIMNWYLYAQSSAP